MVRADLIEVPRRCFTVTRWSCGFVDGERGLNWEARNAVALSPCRSWCKNTPWCRLRACYGFSYEFLRYLFSVFRQSTNIVGQVRFLIVNFNAEFMEFEGIFSCMFEWCCFISAAAQIDEEELSAVYCISSDLFKNFLSYCVLFFLFFVFCVNTSNMGVDLTDLIFHFIIIFDQVV